jgi:hypothetical protein
MCRDVHSILFDYVHGVRTRFRGPPALGITVEETYRMFIFISMLLA